MEHTRGAFHHAEMAEQKVRTRFKRTRPVYIREWRKFRGLTQQQLGDRLNHPASWVSQIETGKIFYTEDSLSAISEALSCTPADLLMRNPLDKSAPWSLADTIRDMPADKREHIMAIVEAMRKAG